MDVPLDSVLLTMILACLVILALRNKNKDAVYSPKAVQSEDVPFVSRRKSTMTDEYSSQDVFRVVITGGPCAGKTTGINKLASALSSSMKVLVVPEASTLLFKGGAMNNFEGLDNNSQVEFQASLMQLQMALEDAFTQIASSSKERSIIICDRGLMDGSAYISNELWQALLDERGWTVVHLRDRRYEAVVHMVTAANGADKFYSLDNNVARYEGLELAKDVDNKLMRAWTGHSHLSVIDNVTTDSFEGKINKMLSMIFRDLGVNLSEASKKKYLIRNTGLDFTGIHVVQLLIEDTFLKRKGDNVSKITKRGQSGTFVYTHHTKKRLDFGEYDVNKCQITAREYILLGSNRDVSRKTVKRLRQCFVYNFNYFMIDTYLNVKKGISVLKTNEMNFSESNLPQNISVVRDITEDKGYSTYMLSKINWYISSEDIDIINE